MSSLAVLLLVAAGSGQRYISMGFDDIAWKPINRAKLSETIHQRWIGAEAMPATAKM